MPAILLIKEMPKTCKECSCQLMLVCVPTDEDIDEYIDPSKGKPDWCPLRPLPQKAYGEFPCTYEYGFIDGYNKCLDEIMGETE